MKRKITFFLTLIMLLSFIAVPANAAVKPPDASIQWTHILNPDLTVDFDGTVFYFPDLVNNKIYTKSINPINGMP